jgi:predicted nucleotidyltransferase
MEEWIARALEEERPISSALEKQIMDNGLKTGSYVFGDWNRDRDIDIVLPPSFPYPEELKRREKVYDKGSSWESSESSFLSEYVITRDGQILNLIFVQTDQEYRVWNRATRATRNLRDLVFMRKILDDKESRVAVFEGFKQLIREYLEGKGRRPSRYGSGPQEVVQDPPYDDIPF